MIRILLADDHLMFRQGLKELLNGSEEFTVVAEASDGGEALKLTDRDRPDIAVLDVNMPVKNGLEVAAELAGRKDPPRIVLLTMVDNPRIVIEALKLPVDGYVMKDNAFEDLLYALHAAMRGTCFISPSLTAVLRDFSLGRDKALRNLSPREGEVLRYIAAGMTNREIADKLCISVSTIDTHRERIMQKLNLHRVADLVKYAIVNGLLD